VCDQCDDLWGCVGEQHSVNLVHSEDPRVLILKRSLFCKRKGRYANRNAN